MMKSQFTGAAALAFVVLAAGHAPARADTAQGSSVWTACDAGRGVAYRTLAPGHNPHNAFTHPIKVHMKAGETCAQLAGLDHPAAPAPAIAQTAPAAASRRQ